MKTPLFELSNNQRKYLGLDSVKSHWELVELGEMYLYFDGDTIKKRFWVDNNFYSEQELNEKTTDNRTILLPKTAKGKPRKLNYTGTQSFSPFGLYFNYSQDNISIASYATQTTYYSTDLKENSSIEDLKKWLDDWLQESTEQDLIEINKFKVAKRKHFEYKEGDFFAFKIGRREWGFGRILIDVIKLRNTPKFKEQKNYGLSSIMGKPLIVKVYHKISRSIDIDLEELKICNSLPSQLIMDNHFYYGEKIIIGHMELKPNEYDMLISYSTVIAWQARYVYLQYGMIFKELPISKFDKYIKKDNPNAFLGYTENPYRKEGAGFELTTPNLRECIDQKNNFPFWSCNWASVADDLRNPKNSEIKREIFKAFGLDATKGYEENIKLSLVKVEKSNFISKIIRLIKLRFVMV